MDKHRRQINTDLDIKICIGQMTINVFCINYEAPVPGWSYGNHSHSSYELHFIPSGQGRLDVSGRPFTIGPGTFYLTGPGVFHEQKADYQDPMREFCINFELTLSHRKRPKGALYLQNEVDALVEALTHTNFWFGKDRGGTVQLFEAVIRELEDKTVGYYVYIQNLISQIILNAVRCFTDYRVSDYAIPRKILNDSRRHEMDKYFSDMTLHHSRKDLAGKIGTSIRQLNRVVQEYYGMSFKETVNFMKLEQARYLLTHSRHSVSVICDKCGMSSQSYFCKLFRQHYGVTPARYRAGAGKG